MYRLIRATCAIAAEEIGEEKADRIAEAAQKRCEELLAEKAAHPKEYVEEIEQFIRRLV